MTGVPTFGGASVDDPVFAGLPGDLAEAFGAEDDVDGVDGVVARGSTPGGATRDAPDCRAAIAPACSFGGRATPPADGDDNWAAAVADAEEVPLFDTGAVDAATVVCSLSQFWTSS